MLYMSWFAIVKHPHRPYFRCYLHAPHLESVHPLSPLLMSLLHQVSKQSTHDSGSQTANHPHLPLSPRLSTRCANSALFSRLTAEKPGNKAKTDVVPHPPLPSLSQSPPPFSAHSLHPNRSDTVSGKDYGKKQKKGHRSVSFLKSRDEKTPRVKKRAPIDGPKRIAPAEFRQEFFCLSGLGGDVQCGCDRFDASEFECCSMCEHRQRLDDFGF